MSSLFALLSQQTPNLQTRKGLIVVGLQNDFVLPTGKLPVKETQFVDRIARLVPSFRQHGEVVWVRSEFLETRPVNGDDTPGDTVVAGGSLGIETELPGDGHGSRSEKQYQLCSQVLSARTTTDRYKSSASFDEPDIGEDDEELFLSKTSTREPCCIRGSHGAEYADCIKPVIEGTDLQVTKTHYSAFAGTSLLTTLRSKLITDVYICGCMTNLSVYATAMDAARYGIEITLVEDCLGYRRFDRHQMAKRQLSDLMDANTVKASTLLSRFAADGGDAEDDGTLQPLGGTLEADSDDDDSGDEISFSTVGLPRALFERRSEQSHTTRSAQYSHSAAPRPRITPTQYATPQSSQLHYRQISDPPEERVRKARKGNQTKHATHASSSKIGLIARDSPRRIPGQPWLEIIPLDYRASFDVAHSTAPVQDPEDFADDLSESQDLDEIMTDPVMGQPLFGEEKARESAGSRIVHDFMPDATRLFEELNNEIKWQTMFHQTGQVPRLVCCQATVDEDGSMPVYRHPSDQTLPVERWTPTVERIRQEAEKVAGHPLNHALIQLYRDGNDFISEHSDKTLDIVANSSIINASFGAQRTMRIRTKRDKGDTTPVARTTYRVPMPHNSMIMMSLPTNAEYLHAINWDRRPACELTDAEKAYGGQRISLTFRHIGTYLNNDSTVIWGDGAVGKTKSAARPVVNGDPTESEKLIQAFGSENAASSINWSEIYDSGSDVLHLK
ncbi:hypothetical protein CBER1_09792 [Cercospora berteroae]|uniref:Fe2OG dioxygenase domain-containing protein n=1 Tax=Cercospora berteroae TaxID=357750 RepID=A0A2S6BY18_9PEZI|nr:hypothetical protein CBER1_09792 [Cercospora berteroae]